MGIWTWIIGFIVLLVVIKLVTMKSSDGESVGSKLWNNVKSCCSRIAGN